MDEAVGNRSVWKVFASGKAERRVDEVLLEKPLILEVDGKEEAAVILSPGDEALWALGHLFCRRMITGLADVASVEVGPERISLRRTAARNGLPLRSRIIHTASTRLIESDVFREDRRGRLTIDWAVPFAAVEAAVDALAEAPLFRRTGSAHVALLAHHRSGNLFRVEDVGRHNAMDKAVGWAVREGIDLGECFMALSGRLPADMVYKAVGAAIPLLASVSAATGSGIEAADAGNITLIGFVRDGRMNVYSAPERIRELAPRNGL